MILSFISRQDLNTMLAVLALVLPIIVGLAVRKANARERERLLDEAESAKTKLDAETAEKERIAEGHRELVEKVKKLESDAGADSQTLMLLKQDMLPLSEFMKRKFIDALMHPSPEFKIPDELLEKVKPVGAPMPPELIPYLEERKNSKNPHVSAYEKLAAAGLELAVEMAMLEAEHPELVVTELQLVSSTLKSPEDKRRQESGIEINARKEI